MSSSKEDKLNQIQILIIFMTSNALIVEKVYHIKHNNSHNDTTKIPCSKFKDIKRQWRIYVQIYVFGFLYNRELWNYYPKMKQETESIAWHLKTFSLS